MLKLETKRGIRRRFHRAMLELQGRFGWKAKQIAANYHLPYRSVANWLAGKTATSARRLKALCRLFGWQYEVMFHRGAMEDEAIESQHLDLRALREQYLRIQPRDPLEAWSYVSLAGALVFSKFSAWGFECHATIGRSFCPRIEFRSGSLQLGVVVGRGLVISWLDEQGSIRETMDLSDHT